MQEWIEKTLFSKIDSLWSERDSAYKRVNDSRDTIIEHFRPDMDTDVGSSYDSRLLGHDIYDSTGVYACHQMAVGFMAHQYSKGTDWLNYKFALQILQGVDELDQFCSDVRDHMSQVYQRGNFYDVQLGYAKNAVTIGSPCSFGEEDVNSGEILWTPLHYKTYRLYYDTFNRCIGVITQEQWSIKELYDKFCEGNTKEARLKKAEEICSKSTMTSINSGRWDRKITINRAVFKKNHPVFYGEDFGSRYEYWGVYFEETPKDEKIPLKSEGYFTKPFVVWDYEKNRWESVSRTPAFYCLYDDVTLNQLMFNYITDVQLHTRPAMNVLAEQKGNSDFGPGKRNYIERGDWDYKPEILQQTGDIRWEIEQLRMFQEKVERHFHTKLFNILTEIAMKQTQYISVLQELDIKDEKITQISPMIDSNDNYLRQVDERALDIEYRASRGPFRKDYLMYIADVIAFTCKKAGVLFNGDLVPEFVGKLRKQQQMEQKLKPLRTGMAFLQEAKATIDPNLHIAVRGYDVLDDGFSAIGFPMKNLKPREQFDQEYAQMQEAQAKQLQFQNMVEAMKASKGQNLLPEGQK
jgi:hypothetical protein